MAFLEDQTLPMSQNQNQPRDHHAKEDVASQKVERDRAQAILDRRTVRSPIDGILLRRLMGLEEYVNRQAQIAQIAPIDPLFVDVFLPTEVY